MKYSNLTKSQNVCPIHQDGSGKDQQIILFFKKENVAHITFPCETDKQHKILHGYS